MTVTAAAPAFWVNGSIVADGVGVLRADDHGLVGDGAFEAIKMIDGRPFALTRHLRRLHHSAGALGIAVEDDIVRAGIDALSDAEPVHAHNCWLRVTVTGGSAPMGTGGVGISPTVVVAVAPMAPWGPTCDVAVVEWTRNDSGATAGLKTISYAENVIALRAAHACGADEAIFANTRGNLCEGTGSNVFVAVDGKLITPPLSSGCLAGVTRELLLEKCPDVVEGDLPIAALASASEAFLTSTSRDVHPIATVDGRPLTAAPGPLTGRAMVTFAEIVAASTDP